MFSSGVDTALSEITLVLFTTLAPAGTFALMIFAAVLAFWRFDNHEEERKHINRMFCLPLFVSMIGLIASATHLGNPANALYVFQGVGRSPLSNEVFFAVVFLFLAGVYWLYSFAAKPNLNIQRIWCILILISGAVFITFIAFVYSVETIISWSTEYVPLALWLNAIVGGPLLALLTFQLAKSDKVLAALKKPLIALSSLALLANTTVYIFQSIELSEMTNAFGSAAELLPGYTIMIVIFFVCNIASLFIYISKLWSNQPLNISVSVVAVALSFLGIFIMRFAFYVMHMTVGLGM